MKWVEWVDFSFVFSGTLLEGLVTMVTAESEKEDKIKHAIHLTDRGLESLIFSMLVPNFQTRFLVQYSLHTL